MTQVVERKFTDAELDARDQKQFEKEYEQWCFETALASYRTIDMSKLREMDEKR